MKDEDFDWVETWNAWIDFCKKPMAYDLAKAFTFSLIAYSVVGLGGHYIIGIEARQANSWGIFSMFLILLLSVIFLGMKNGWLKDLFKDMDKEDKL